jgi:hypothetical protein
MKGGFGIGGSQFTTIDNGLQSSNLGGGNRRYD